MSCNGCRVLRKGCREECMLRESLEWIENDPKAQAHATLFVSKFFGRATLMSFLSSVPGNQRSGMFRSLMYEAVGRSINPVSGALGLLWTGNWHACQMAVQRVLRGEPLLLCQEDEDAFAFHQSQPSHSAPPTGLEEEEENYEKLAEEEEVAAGHSASQSNLLKLFF